ncbi:hypothetical protein [Staphylococcus gallinarum]|uniref:hypothetical protein n=1 Tax=Staphylococcus TaxID=1279 RepID=UPI000E690117|nr:hypothetical protein [Staphylococcus gallinarum]RIL18492.1 hypothetical protein BUY99_13670 [Staphylococcus gallinarum]
MNKETVNNKILIEHVQKLWTEPSIEKNHALKNQIQLAFLRENFDISYSEIEESNNIESYDRPILLNDDGVIKLLKKYKNIYETYNMNNDLLRFKYIILCLKDLKIFQHLNLDYHLI